MDWNELQDGRLAVIAKLVGNAPSGFVGRTALMKFCYLLQTVRKVPLGYRFTLYSYGPFDPDVLADLGTAENLGAVNSSVVQYSGGYGYRIRKGERAESTIRSGLDFVRRHSSDIDWVLAEFGTHGSADLELETTIVFVDRETERKRVSLPISDLVSTVKTVKPHFGEEVIAARAADLQEKNLLRSVRAATTARP